jgi:hypothetical protein
MRHQHTLRHPGRIRVVQPFDLEAGQCCLHPLRDRQVGDEAAAVDAHQVAGKLGHKGGGIGHRGGLLRAVRRLS